MSNGAPASPPPPDGVLELLRELQALEDAGEHSDLRLGPLSGYLMLAALTGAMRAPRVTGSLLAAGHTVQAEIHRAARDLELRGPHLPTIYARLDALSSDAGPGMPVPGDDFVELITVLQEGETQGVRLDVHIGPFTLFYAISLLQLALRHPSVAEHLETTAMPQSPVETIARGLTENFGGYARELLERGFDPRFDTDAQGRPLHPEHYTGDPAFGAAGVCADDGAADDEGAALLVGLGPDLIYDVVTVATAACPSCGSNPAFAISAQQAVCGNDDCAVFFWNPQQTAEQFWATARPQVLARDPKTGIVSNVDHDAVPEGWEVVGGSLSDVLEDFGAPPAAGQSAAGQSAAGQSAAGQSAAGQSAAGEHVDEQRHGQQGDDAEHD